MPPAAKRQKLDTAATDKLRDFQALLARSKSVLALCGAGLSVSSGLPTFRGSGGLWKNFSSIDLATPDAFDIDPGLVWQFYTYRRYCALQAEPNAAHRALAKLSVACPKRGIRYLTLDQNVDNLNVRCGHARGNYVELHGSLFDLKCTNFLCSYTEKGNYRHPLTVALSGCEDEFAATVPGPAPGPAAAPAAAGAAGDEPAAEAASVKSSPDFAPVHQIADADLPHCPTCETGLLRPGVVWFGESLPLAAIDRADEFLIKNDPVDVILVIGTSASVWPAAGYIDRVRQQGGKVAVFNTEIEQPADVDFAFLGDCAESLPEALAPFLGDDAAPHGTSDS